jgi:hypothetical protein
MKEELGLIRKTFLGYESHGMFTFVIEFDFGGSGQAFGNYVIGIHGDKSEINQEEVTLKNSYGTEAIMKILDAVGVNKWEDLVGKECWVRRDNGTIVEIEAPAYRKHGKLFNIKEFFDEKLQR